MAENTVKVNISFQSLKIAISSLGVAEKYQLWELLEAELFQDDEYDQEDIAEIQVARADYKVGDYMTFDEYRIQRTQRSVSTGFSL